MKKNKYFNKFIFEDETVCVVEANQIDCDQPEIVIANQKYCVLW